MTWMPTRRGLLRGTALALLWPLSAAAGTDELPVPELIEIPAGPFWSGSDAAERELGYSLDEAAYGHSRTREFGWYDVEYKRKQRQTGAYRITRNLITNRQYAAFLAATGHPVPDVDPETWKSYRLIHPYSRTRRHAWKGGVRSTMRPSQIPAATSTGLAMSHGSSRTGRVSVGPSMNESGRGRRPRRSERPV